MSGRVVFRRILLAVQLVSLISLVSCYDDDDGYGPTEPLLPVPRIAGIWSGFFSTNEGEAIAVFDLVQSGRQVSGVVSVGAILWSLQGEVDSRGIFRWRTGSGTCGSFDGSADVTTATHMEGRAELDRFFCPEGERRTGDLDLDRENRR